MHIGTCQKVQHLTAFIGGFHPFTGHEGP